MSTARTRANRKYNEKAYDRIGLTVPKGRKAIIAEAAAAATPDGMSVNAFINAAIDEKMARQNTDAGRER